MNKKHPPPLWLAVFNNKIAYALDAYPHEVKRYSADLKRHGNYVTGPFSNYNLALKVATNGLLVLTRRFRIIGGRHEPRSPHR